MGFVALGRSPRLLSWPPRPGGLVVDPAMAPAEADWMRAGAAMCRRGTPFPAEAARAAPMALRTCQAPP
eukprot:3825787-Alexandrium_andersonii.AAC.1